MNKETFVPAGDWTVGELESKLLEFYTSHDVETTVRIDNRRQLFQADGIRYWMSQGYMEPTRYFNEDSVLGAGRGQYSAFFFGLTEKGKNYVETQKAKSKAF